jgi:predicted O-methyltransferase YrrM
MIISNSFRDLVLSKIAYLQKQKKQFNSTSSNYWNITDEQGIFLANLVDFKKPKSILEIGTSNGFSGLYLNLNLPEESNYTTVEIDKIRFELAKSNFEEVGLKNYNCVNCDALKFLGTLNKDSNSTIVSKNLDTDSPIKNGDKNLTIFDFIFVDAGHCLYQDILDLLISRKLLDEKCILVFDNVTSHSQLNDFVKDIYEKYDSELIKIGGGMLVINF